MSWNICRGCLFVCDAVLHDRCVKCGGEMKQGYETAHDAVKELEKEILKRKKDVSRRVLEQDRMLDERRKRREENHRTLRSMK